MTKKQKIKYKKQIKNAGYSLFTLILLTWFVFFGYQNGVQGISGSGKDLLNDYEGIYSMDWKFNIGGSCLKAYDVGDGVITVGFGNTYPSEEIAIDDINNKTKGHYKVGDCIKRKDLEKIQDIDLRKRSKEINSLDQSYDTNLTANQFDAVLLLYYLNEATIKDKSFWTMISNENVDKQEYIDYFVGKFSNFELWSIYKKGWVLRIKDSAELFFDGDYNRNH